MFRDLATVNPSLVGQASVAEMSANNEHNMWKILDDNVWNVVY